MDDIIDYCTSALRKFNPDSHPVDYEVVYQVNDDFTIIGVLHDGSLIKSYDSAAICDQFHIDNTMAIFVHHKKALSMGDRYNNMMVFIPNNLQYKEPYYDAKIFADYLTDPLSGGKRTFMRPSRRSHGSPSKLLTPGRFPKRGHKNRLTHLVYALDVSGSITKQQAQQFHDSVRTIKELLNPEKLTVLLFDTRIVFEKTFTDKEKYGNIAVHAGGGTNLKDVYKRMSQLDAEAMVCFTDLCVTIPPQPSWESIWIVPHMRCSVPVGLYGEVYLMPEIK